MSVGRKSGYYSLTLLVVVAVQSIAFAQTTYFVATTGNDTNTGRSASEAFRSLSKVNSLPLVAGDSVLFRRGDTFRGGLIIRKSGTAGKPIVFDAYGSGPKPVIAGSVPVTNWTSLGNNIWQASCRDCGSRITGLYRNAVALPLGRYPNPDAPSRGYLTIQSHSTNNQLTSQQPLVTDWTGGEVVVRPTYWIIDRATINAQRGNTLTLANTSTYSLTDGWGYFIQDHPATLDQTGEWYYDPVAKQIRLYDDKNNPNNQVITATRTNVGIDLADVSFVSLRNLHIRETLTESLFADNVSNLTLSQDMFTDAGENGVTVIGSGQNVLIENSQIRNINNNGLFIDTYKNVTLRANTIRNISLLPGRGKSGDGQSIGVRSLAANTLIENNIVDSIGYIGISLWNDMTARQNIVSNFCMTKSDGGGIYIWNGQKRPMSNIKIVSNIVRNGIGTPGGTADETFSGAHGIFLDDCVEGVELTNNTILNCNGLGIYLHAINNVSLTGNTSFGNTTGQLILYNNDNLCRSYGNTIRRNIFMSPWRGQGVVGYMAAANDLSSYADMGYNYYSRPFDDVFTIRAVYNKTIGDDYALPQWQTQFSEDLTSKISPITYKDYQVQSLNPQSRISSLFANSVDDWTTWSSFGNGRAVWDNTNRLNAGSMRIDFSSPSNIPGSYVLVYKGIQAVVKSKSYLLRFDATASGSKKLFAFIRQQQSPYQDLTQRYGLLVGTTPQHYELALTATADEAQALLTFQTPEDGQTVWLDNIQLQEVTINPVDPTDYVRLVYNPTQKDSLITLTDAYRDVKNHYYGHQVLLKPFTSVALLKDTMPPVDVRLSLQASQKAPATSSIVSLSISLHNESGNGKLANNRVQWVCRLPANLTMVDVSGFVRSDSVLTGTVNQLSTDTTVVVLLRAATPGTYAINAQVTASTYADPDSTPDSGMGDGEDDTTQITFVVSDSGEIVTGLTPATPAESSQVYPNPAIDEFTFVAERAVQTLEVTDMLGRRHVSLGAVHRGQSIQFGRQLAAGQYLLTIQYEGGTKQVMKLIKSGR